MFRLEMLNCTEMAMIALCKNFNYLVFYGGGGRVKKYKNARVVPEFWKQNIREI